MIYIYMYSVRRYLKKISVSDQESQVINSEATEHPPPFWEVLICIMLCFDLYLKSCTAQVIYRKVNRTHRCSLTITHWLIHSLTHLTHIKFCKQALNVSWHAENKARIKTENKQPRAHFLTF